MPEWVHCDDCEKNGTDDCPHLMDDEIRVSSCKEGVHKGKLPSVIIEKTIIDEGKGRVFVRQYDANAPSDPPTKKQVCFQDPAEEGCMCVDWSEDKVEILSLLGIDFYILDPKNCANCDNYNEELGETSKRWAMWCSAHNRKKITDATIIPKWCSGKWKEKE